MRAIANAFDKNVDWEPQTSTVVLGSKNYDWLDQMGYVDYETTGNKNTLKAWKAGSKAQDGIKYERGIEFLLGYNPVSGARENNDESLSSYQNVEYLLNNSYKAFKGTIVCGNGSNNQTAIIKVYGDGELLYTSPPISEGAKAVPFDIDVEGYKVLKIKADIPNVSQDRYSTASSIGIVDARLEKTN